MIRRIGPRSVSDILELLSELLLITIGGKKILLNSKNHRLRIVIYNINVQTHDYHRFTKK